MKQVVAHFPALNDMHVVLSISDKDSIRIEYDEQEMEKKGITKEAIQEEVKQLFEIIGEKDINDIKNNSIVLDE